MFAALCIYSNPVNVFRIWNTHKDSMMEDYVHRGLNAEQAENMALHSINAVLIENGTNCQTIGLSEPVGMQQVEYEDDVNQPGIATLTDEQRVIADAAIEAVEKKRRDEVPECSCFYVDAPGGCGKTYMLRGQA